MPNPTSKIAPITHIVKYTDGKSKKVTMSFGLINTLSGYISGIADLPYIFSDPSLREGVLMECLALRDEEGTIEEVSAQMNELLSMDEALSLLEWVGEHLTDFFTRALNLSTAAVQKAQSQLSSVSIPDGTKA